MKKMPRWLNQGAEIVTAMREVLDVDASYYDHGTRSLYRFTSRCHFLEIFRSLLEWRFGTFLDFWGCLISLGRTMDFQGVLSPPVYAEDYIFTCIYRRRSQMCLR